MRHLLVTNDFPPKVGGIQSYLWELWRRLPPEDVVVLTSPHLGSRRWDARQSFQVIRTREPVLLPSPMMAKRVRTLAAEVGASAVVIDPAMPLGMIGSSLGLPYAVVLHGSEVTVPGRLPVTRRILRRVLADASLVIAAGGYPEAEARRCLGQRAPFPPAVQISPGVDIERFVPLASIDRASIRARLGLPTSGYLVTSVSRLVPRKGMDTLIHAAADLAPRYPDLHVAISGAGRDRFRLKRLIDKTAAPVRLMGYLDSDQLPGLYACSDVFAMCCRSRWRGLEQEGFGIVFLEAAAAGIPVVAGDSGGAAEAVLDGETGIVVRDPTSKDELAAALAQLFDDPVVARRLGEAARHRAETSFGYDSSAAQLAGALEALAQPKVVPPPQPDPGDLPASDSAPAPGKFVGDERRRRLKWRSWSPRG